MSTNNSSGISLNCDMGESFGSWTMGRDAEIMPYIDRTNIACGFHASDFNVMWNTVALAVKHNVTIGAHPGYPDLQGFGRRAFSMSKQEIVSMVLYQYGALQTICKAQGTTVSYIKPHGALYNTMMKDMSVFEAILEAASYVKDDAALMIMSTKDNDTYKKLAANAGVRLLFEAFIDRAYDNNGLLVDRKIPGAVHKDIGAIEKQIRHLVIDNCIETISGDKIELDVDTLCIHGDSVLSVESATIARKVLSEK